MPKKIAYILFLIVFIGIFYSCSSIKDTSEKKQSNLKEKTIDSIETFQVLNLRKGLNNFESTGEVTININNDEFSGNFELGYINNKHCILNIYGPFGLNIASVEIKSDSLKIANLWHKKYYQTHTKIKSTELDLNYLELIRKLLIAEPLIDSIIIKNKGDTLDFSHTFDKGKASYKYIISNSNLIFSEVEIEQYQVKLMYNNYKKNDSNYYPYKLVFEIDSLNAKVTFEIEELEILNDLDKYKPIEYNKLQKVNDINKLLN